MKTKLIALFSLLFLFGAVMISCDEEGLLPTTPDTTSVEDNAAAETGVARVFENVNNYGISEEGKKSIMNDAPDSIKWNDDNTTIIMYFGDGTIEAAFSGAPNWLTTNLSADVTVVNFDVNGTKMDGVFTIAFAFNFDFLTLSFTAAPTFDIVADNDVKFTADTISNWKGTKHIEWNGGYDTPVDETDDIFLFSGNSGGTNSNGNAYVSVISEENPLERRADCEYISKGIMTITETIPAEEEGGEPTESVMEIDFGDGTCDSEMLVTVDGIEISVDQ